MKLKPGCEPARRIFIEPYSPLKSKRAKRETRLLWLAAIVFGIYFSGIWLEWIRRW